MNNRKPQQSRLFGRCAAAATLGAALFSGSLWAVPEAPSITRTVYERGGDGANNITLTKPHITPWHTSQDGRIVVDMKPHGGNNGPEIVDFYLNCPERLTTHFINAQPGAEDLLATDPADSTVPQKFQFAGLNFVDLIINDSAGNAIGDQRHVTIIDKTVEFDQNDGYTNNPVAATDDNGDDIDVYNVTIHSTVEYESGPNDGQIRHQFTPIKVVVKNPKTASAYIESITVQPGATSSNYITVRRGLLETRFTNDGKLLVGRIGTPGHSWIDPRNGNTVTRFGYADVVYAYSENGTLNGDDNINLADGFDNLIPLSFAPRDPRINTKYGFAMFPFRDSQGNAIEPGRDIQGSYPWIDSEGTNVAMTTISAMLHQDEDPNNPLPRYPNIAYDNTAPTFEEDQGNFQGVSMVGLWTQGKIVTLDNSLNNIDWGIGADDAEHRILVGNPHDNDGFYEKANGDANLTSLPITNGRLRVGSGRYNGGAHTAIVGNSAFFDSIENKFQHEEFLQPVAPHDVVWWVSNGRSTAQFAFDDYLYVDSFIVAKMNGSLEWQSDQTTETEMIHHDGWDATTNTFSNTVLIANDGCAVPSEWNIPAYGTLKGDGARLEPVAHGGIEGKGLWLERTYGLEFAIGNQPQTVSNSDWYVGIFVDSRSNGTQRSLITFPDGSAIHLVGRASVKYIKPDGTDGPTISIPGSWSRNEWAHFGFQILENGTTIEFYYNGFLVASHRELPEMFQMDNGTLTVGKVSGSNRNGYRGWFDDFKVFATAFDPEVCANHARGTLVGVNTGNHTALEAQADLYSGVGETIIDDILLHSGQTTYDRYAVHYDYTKDNGAHLGNIPLGAARIRESMLFPESPLFHDVHRPDSINNAFCILCHDNDYPSSVLKLAALQLDSGTLAKNDARRQPMQSPRRVFGHIPANWKGSGLPSSATTSSNAGLLIDEYIQSASTPDSREVVTLSLVDGNGVPIVEVKSGQTIDYLDNTLGITGTPGLRANLDAGQGSVDFVAVDSSSTAVSIDAVVDEAPYEVSGLENGTFDIIATPFQNSGGTGTQGVSKTVTNVTFQNMPVAGAATAVADYRDDFQGGTPETGWSYQRCTTSGQIGTASNYVDMNWDAVNGYYKTNANINGTLHATGGKARHNRIIIAAYEIQTAGTYSLADTDITVDATSTNGVRLRVHVNDTQKLQINIGAGVSKSFDLSLGSLSAGDDVYVSVDPRQEINTNDNFTWDFTLMKE